MSSKVRDYVAMIVLNKRNSNNNIIFIDYESPLSWHGRYAIDPINEKYVNVKIKWGNEYEKVSLKVPKDVIIHKGDEVFVSYGGLSYWEENIDSIRESLRDYL